MAFCLQSHADKYNDNMQIKGRIDLLVISSGFISSGFTFLRVTLSRGGPFQLLEFSVFAFQSKSLNDKDAKPSEEADQSEDETLASWSGCGQGEGGTWRRLVFADPWRLSEDKQTMRKLANTGG